MASTGCHHAHLLCGLAGRHHDLLHLLHRVCSGKLFPCLDLWLGNDHLITPSFALGPFESREQAFLIFRRSLITWSPGFASGNYDTNLVTAGLDMLEVGARQLNDWRLHELPDFLPFCQPGVPLNTPMSSLAATSSLSTTWSVHKPPSLKRRLCPAKRLRGHITVDLRGAGAEFQTFVPSAFLTLHQTPF